MEGIIKNYRRGRHTQKPRQAIIEVREIDSKKKAFALIGKRVEFQTASGKTIAGKITAVHGDNGAVRAIFSKGIPGQAISSKIQIL